MYVGGEGVVLLEEEGSSQAVSPACLLPRKGRGLVVVVGTARVEAKGYSKGVSAFKGFVWQFAPEGVAE